MVKLDACRSSVTGTCVRTLATWIAEEVETGMAAVTRALEVAFMAASMEGEVREELVAAAVPGKDGNFTHGYGYPRIPYPHGQGMGTILYPWVVPIPYPLSHG